MKRLLNITAGIIATMLAFAACDKIDVNDYLVFAGSSGSWYDGQPVEDQSQRVFVEKYTGVRCVNCPSADEAIATLQSTYGHEVVAVSIHAGAMARPWSGFADLRTNDGDEWNSYFGIEAYPSVMINRGKTDDTWNIITAVGGIAGGVEGAMGHPTTIAMEIDTEYDAANRNLTIFANLQWLESTTAPLTITLMVMEDGIVGKQTTPEGNNENYVFNHVLRDVITDLWGADIDADGNQGTCRMGAFAYTLPDGLVAENCHIVAFISNKDTREILQCAEASVME